VAEEHGSSSPHRFRLPWALPAQQVARRDHAASPLLWRETLRSRLLVFAVVFAVWTIGIEARLFYLQVLEHADMVARAENQQRRTIDAIAPRGDIYDRFGQILAYSADAETIGADPTHVEDPEKAARALCAVLDCTPESRRDLARKLGRKQNATGKPIQYISIARQISPTLGRRVADLELPGVIVLRETRRYYPNRALGANFLGYVGTDNEGLGGLEAKFDSRIRGRNGRIFFMADGRQRAMGIREEQPATPGDSIELTIDETLQHIADRELRAGVEQYNAKAGMAIVMDPHTGEILALSNYPTFNPNDFGSSTGYDRANRAVQHVYEPGSTFKLITAAAAIEERVLKTTDMIDCAPGFIRVPGRGRPVYDVHPYGPLSFEDVIVKSSNVGAIKAVQQIGIERMSIYVKRFGFGQILSSDFGGQSRGIVWSADQLDESGLASISMGYQIGVTPIQMAAAVSSIANGGTLYEPRMIRAFAAGGRREAVPAKVVRRTVSPETAATLTGIMEQVVERGTAKAARIDGYTIAGKTGTAAKVIDGAYSKTDYNVSFVGFAPSRKPALAVVVVIDTPRAEVTSYGGTIAAPIFKRIAEASLRHLGVGPNLNAPPPVLVTRNDDRRAIQPALATLGPERVIAPARMGMMPDLRGLSARDAVQALGRIGMRAVLTGDGFVVSQEPEAHSALVPGDAVQLKLGRRPPGPPAGDPHQ
jgi:cell division protein FtsI (penicillin-binding protein 3)